MGDIFVRSETELFCNGQRFRCAIGLNGFTDTPQEGAKKTPVGRYALRECWYRPDRLAPPDTGLPLRVIHKNDGWCDDPADANYNTRILLPFDASHEKLWRLDNIYDIVVPIGFNDDSVVPGLGSAIFFHLAKPDYLPTLGCIAVSKKDMLAILKYITAKSIIHIMTKVSEI